MAKTRIHSTLFLCLIAGASCWLPATRAAAADDMEWQFYESNDPDNKSRATARLVYGVPETDNVQVTGVCDATRGIGVQSSSVTFGAEIGDLENGKQVELRVSGGGFDHPLKGEIYRSTGEEGLNGVRVDIKHDDPLWAEMDEKESLDYLVPGYRAATLDFTRGRNKIKQFVQACRAYPAAPTGEQADAKAKETGGDSEKEAFESAKELGTVEAWEAFVTNYPSGFRADLARAYIKKLGEQPQAAAPPADQPPTAATGSGEFPIEAASWGGIVRSGPGQSYSKVGSLTEGQKVTLIARTNVVEDGFPWFDIAFAGKRGFQWGGIMCSTGTERPDLFKTCAPPAKAAPANADTKKRAAKGCGKHQMKIEGKCINKRDAASYCGPGYRLQGNKCVQGYAAPKKQKQLPSWQLEAIAKGCRPGQGWNPQEGCHEND